MSCHTLSEFISNYTTRQLTLETASDSSWQNVSSADADMESVADSSVTAVSNSEETLVEKIQELEEVCNLHGSQLHA